MPTDRPDRTATVLLTAGLLLLAYLLSDVLLLVFAAVLIAIGLDGAARGMSARLPLSRGWALVVVTLGIAAIIVGSLTLTATRLIRQFRELSERVLQLAERVRTWLVEQGATDVIDRLDIGGGALTGTAGDMAGRVLTSGLNFGLTAAGALSSFIVLVALTLFLAASPALYRKGTVRLVPPRNRGMVEDTLSAIAHSLRWWFVGQMASMALLGLTVGLGLMALGIELWFALAVLTALLTFIPFIGPLIATVPIVAVGFAAGVQTGWIVLIGYTVIQVVEGNVLVPMIQQKAVDLAPALLIAVQVLFTLIFGIAGLILAAPLTIVAMVAVQKLWVEHTLGEKA